VLPAGIPRSTSTASGRLDVIVGADTATVLKADGPVFGGHATKSKLSVGPDTLSNLVAATATGPGAAPVSVAFAYRIGSGPWYRIDVDTSPPFRGFIDPAKFSKHEHIQLIGVERALDGTVAASAVVPFTVP